MIELFIQIKRLHSFLDFILLNVHRAVFGRYHSVPPAQCTQSGVGR